MLVYLTTASFTTVKPLKKAIFVNKFDTATTSTRVIERVIRVPRVSTNSAHVLVLLISIFTIGSQRRSGDFHCRRRRQQQRFRDSEEVSLQDEAGRREESIDKTAITSYPARGRKNNRILFCQSLKLFY